MKITVIDYPLSHMISEGHLKLSERPGLGVDLVEDEMEKHPGILEEKEGFMCKISGRREIIESV